MKRFWFRLGVAVITLTIGILSFYVFNFFQKDSSPEVENKRVVEKNNVNVSQTVEDFDPWKLPEGFRPLEKGEFFLVGHACGNGYSQGWLAYDNSHLNVGFSPIKSVNIKKELAGAERIIEEKKNSTNKDGKKGLRIILQGRNEKTGKEFYEIIWYSKKIGMYYVVGPNLEITLELEAYLNSRK